MSLRQTDLLKEWFIVLHFAAKNAPIIKCGYVTKLVFAFKPVITFSMQNPKYDNKFFQYDKTTFYTKPLKKYVLKHKQAFFYKIFGSLITEQRPIC